MHSKYSTHSEDQITRIHLHHSYDKFHGAVSPGPQMTTAQRIPRTKDLGRH